MENSGSVRARNTAQENQDSTKTDLLSTKPLHRFVQREPKSVGVALLMFGCAEILVGFVMASVDDDHKSSVHFYTAFWQGALFIICGILSICTGIYPSKKRVTVCLSMYVVSLLGIIVSFGFRIASMANLSFSFYRHSTYQTAKLLIVFEVLLFLTSICVSGLLIYFCVVARLALKSTRTQIVLHQIPPPVTVTPTEEN